MLWRIVRLDLQLLATHPDRVGGLGSLGVVDVDLAPWSFGISAIVAASFAEQMKYLGVDGRSIVMPVVATIVASTFVLVAPLLLFLPKLLEAKQHALLSTAVLAASYTRRFDEKWVHSEAPLAELLGSADIQSLADLAGSFDLINEMRLVPITRTQVWYLLGAAVVPALPLVLLVLPLDELILHGVKTVLDL